MATKALFPCLLFMDLKMTYHRLFPASFLPHKWMALGGA